MLSTRHTSQGSGGILDQISSRGTTTAHKMSTKLSAYEKNQSNVPILRTNSKKLSKFIIN